MTDRYEERQPIDYQRELEADYQRHLRREDWPEAPHPTDCCPDEQARAEAWGR